MTKGQSFFDITIVLLCCLGMVFVIGVALGAINPDLEYTQSEVDALMKFNASEFGCSIYGEPMRQPNDGVMSFKCEYGGNVKGVFYYPRWDGVKIELDPERQECWNESKILKTNIVEMYVPKNYTIFTRCMVEDSFGRVYWNSAVGNVSCAGFFSNFTKILLERERVVLEYFCDVGFFLQQDYSESSDSPLCVKRVDVFGNITKCQTVPAVTKLVSGWAENENDLATEFCRAETYQTSVIYGRCIHNVWEWNGTKWYDFKYSWTYDWKQMTKEEKHEYDFACGGYPTLWAAKIGASTESIKFESKVEDETKPFTRGEVVEIEKQDPNGICKPNMFCYANQIIKQKLIRCYGDDGYQQDFEVLK